MLELRKQVILYQDKLYIVLRTIKESSNPIISDFKEHLNADLVLKKNGTYFFLSSIDEAQIIEKEEEPKID